MVLPSRLISITIVSFQVPSLIQVFLETPCLCLVEKDSIWLNTIRTDCASGLCKPVEPRVIVALIWISIALVMFTRLVNFMRMALITLETFLWKEKTIGFLKRKF